MGHVSATSIIFSELPKNVQKKLPGYKQTSAILLGRLGVDKAFSLKRAEELGAKPRLGELLLIDAQRRSLTNTKELGSALMVIDAELPTAVKIVNGARDPIPFYVQYGFVPLTNNPRRVVKTMRAIAQEFEKA